MEPWTYNSRMHVLIAQACEPAWTYTFAQTVSMATQAKGGKKRKAAEIADADPAGALPRRALLGPPLAGAVKRPAASESRAAEPARRRVLLGSPVGAASLTSGPSNAGPGVAIQGPSHAGTEITIQEQRLKQLYREALESASEADAKLVEEVRLLGRYPRSLDAAGRGTASEENLHQRVKKRLKKTPLMHSSCLDFPQTVLALCGALASFLCMP